MASASLLPPAAPGPPGTTAADWDRALEAVLANPDAVTVVFQPIVDLARGLVTGFETLARFNGPIAASPDVWFGQAQARNCGLDLEARAAAHALQAAADLPTNCFLTLNVSPDLLLSSAWSALLMRAGRLDGIVVEVTEHASIPDYGAVARRIDDIRSRGGAFAVDDAGSGFASLQHVLALRPDFVKLDRAFISDCDRDPAKRALIEMMGSFSGRLDAWIVAEGVETYEELQTLATLRVPLAQGYLLGRPRPEWASLPSDVSTRLWGWRDRREAQRTVAGIAEAVVRARSFDQANDVLARAPKVPFVLIEDAHGRPMSLAQRSGLYLQPMRIRASSVAVDVLRRALTRPPDVRLSPVAVVDERGLATGIVQIDRLVDLVAFDGSGPSR
ncbi:MAG: EAL domain-containing protein [Vicinamibacterales bacterium]